MKSLFKAIFTTTLLAVVLLGANELIFAQNFEGSLVSERKSGTSSSAEREILSLLLELRSINLNEDIFQSNVFRSLRDFGVTLESQPVGRSNPFSPIGNDRDTTDNDSTGLDDLGLDDLDFDDFGI